MRLRGGVGGPAGSLAELGQSLAHLFLGVEVGLATPLVGLPSPVRERPS